MEVVIPDLDDFDAFAPPPRIHSPAASASGSSAVDSGRASFDDGHPSPFGTLSGAQGPIRAGGDAGAIGSSSGSRTPGNYGAPQASATPGGPFRGAALGWHGRSGSATSDSSAGGTSFRFPTNAGAMPSQSRFDVGAGGNAPASPSHHTGNFSFPVKKSSFASLKAAIKGQSQSSYRDRDAYDAWGPRTPREPYRHAPGSDAGESTAGRRTAYPTPKPGTAGSSSSVFAAVEASPSAPYALQHGRRDSQLSGHSRTQASGGTSSFSGAAGAAARSSRYHHAQQSSYYSDSHHSLGAGSSSAGSLMQPFAKGGTELPPVPPLPFFNGGGSDYGAAPGTPGTEPVDPAFLNARAMASSTSFEHSDAGSPRKWATARLHDDVSQRRFRAHDDADEASSGEYGQHHMPPGAFRDHSSDAEHRESSPSRRPSATTAGRNHPLANSPLAASLGAEGLGYLPQGIGSEDPKAPSEYALNILMSRYIALTSLKVQAALASVSDADPERMSALGPQIDESIESLYGSLSHVAKRSAWAVLESLINWKQLHVETPVDAAAVRRYLAESRQLQSAETSTKEVAALLARKKELITLYLLAKSMIAIAKDMGRNALTEAQAGYWEDCAFNMLLRCSRESDRERALPRSISAMRQSCFEKVSMLIGEISRIRFLPISEHFVSILDSAKEAPGGKNVEEMLVAAIQSMGHLKITVYPMDLFEEGAEFVEILSRHFSIAHGTRIKTAYAEAFVRLLLPVAQSATAEINHPVWIKGIDCIWPRALSMSAKPRYWAAAFSLTTALLAVSPADKFLASWYSCIEAGATKLKDRVYRTIVLNASLRLLWVYLFRCHESSSTTNKRLESFFRIWFPAGRKSTNPSDCSLEPLISMVHLVLHRHFDFGKDLVLGFLCHAELGGSTLSLQPDILSARRMTVAIRAILLTLHCYVQEESPAFPAGADFSRYEFETLPDGCGDELPEGFSFPRAEIGEVQSQFNDLIGKISLICDHQVSDMTVFDERTQIFRSSAANSLTASGDRATLEREGFTWKTHGSAKLLVAYPREHQSHCDLLKACFAAWPRCLSANIAFSGILGILFRAQFSADPDLADASAAALKRIAQQRKGGSTAVVSGFMRWIFRQESAFWEIHPKQTLLIAKVERAIRLWTDFLRLWLAELQAQNSSTAADAPGAKGFEMERTSAWAIIDEVEAHALFLLCSASRSLRWHAIEVLKLVSVLDEAFLPPPRRAALEAAKARGEEEVEEPTRVIHLLNLPHRHFADEPGASASRMSGTPAACRPAQHAESLQAMAQSAKASEQQIWQKAFPTLLRMCVDRFPTTVAVFRTYMTKRALGMDHVILVAANIVSRPQVGTMGSSSLGKSHSTTSLATASSTTFAAASAFGSEHDVSHDQALMADNWRSYILALCTTTTSTEGSRGGGGHRRKSSDADAGERVISAKDLFQKMVPFLASSQARFRDAVVAALGNINDNLFGTLLDTMQSVSSTLNDDFKVRSVARSGLKRNRRLDRLRTALGQVLQLNAHHLRDSVNIRDAKIVNTIQTWVRETFSFLNDREIRQDWEFHTLRSAFCGVTEEFFDGVTQLGEVERYFPYELRVRMFRVIREWHSYSNTSEEGPAKLANMLAAAADQHRDDRAKEQAVLLLRKETQTLSYLAGRTMASLCQGAIADARSVNPSPSGASSLEAASLLSWLSHLFSTADKKSNEVARRALRSLLIHNTSNLALIEGLTERCIVEPDRASDGRSFFGVVSDVVVTVDALDVPSHRLFCLGLIKIGNPDPAVRRKAFDMLQHVATTVVGPTASLGKFEVGATSPSPAIYLRAQRHISERLADLFGDLKSALLSEFARWAAKVDETKRATTLGLLPEWLRGLGLIPITAESVSERPDLAYRTHLDLSNLLFLTVQYDGAHSFEIQDAWSSLVSDTERKHNVDAVIRFLIDQGLRFHNPEFVLHAKRVVSCLSHTAVGRYMFDELCALVEPGRMIPVPRDDPPPPPSEEHAALFCADLDRLLPEAARKLTFSPGQLALFLVGEMAYERREQLAAYLPALLHAVLMHLDSFSPFVQRQADQVLEKLLRCVISTFPIGDGGVSRQAESRRLVESLFADKEHPPRWSLDDAENELVDHCKMPKPLFSTVTTTLSILEPYLPDFREEWGAVALLWAISGPVRHMACRSFQTFRAVQPKVTPSMMADMLGRLSDTISDPSLDIQAFALEILYTLNLVIRTSDVIQQDFLAQSWWATLACLSTVNEREFGESISMLDSLIDKLDIGDLEVVDMLKIKCPEGWEGEAGGVRGLVFRGLRSSVTFKSSFGLLCKLAKCRDAALIDHDDSSRLGFLFVAALPWFLQATDDHFQETAGAAQAAKNDQRKQAGIAAAKPVAGVDNSVVQPGPAISPLSIIERQQVLNLASDLAEIAERLEMKDLHRVATSIAKMRFRTKDDLVRQAVNCIRARYMPTASADMAVLLLSITLNEVEWLRRQTMQLLKIFFKVIDTRNDAAFSNLGSELLMPLLRLLSTPLSAEALEVLDEPISINGGPASNQILRMSLQWGKHPGLMREQVSDASIFGPPEDTGWAVALPQDLTTRTRINIQSVFKMCELTLDIAPMSSNVNFVVEDGYDLVVGSNASMYMLPDEASGMRNSSIDEHGAPPELSEIVNQLHDLSSFFVEENRRPALSGGSIRDRRSRFGSLASALGGGSQSLSRQSSLRNLPYNRHMPQDSEASAADTSKDSSGGGDSPASRPHTQIAKILARSAFAGRMSFSGARPGSVHRRPEQRNESGQSSQPPSSDAGYRGGVPPTRSISEPMPSSPESQRLYLAAARNASSQTALPLTLEEAFESPQPTPARGDRVPMLHSSSSEPHSLHSMSGLNAQEGVEETYDDMLSADTTYGMPSTNSGSLSFGLDSSSPASTMRTIEPGGPYHAAAGGTSSAASSFDLRNAHAALQELAAVGLGAPFEESPATALRTKAREARVSPTRPRTMLVRRPTENLPDAKLAYGPAAARGDGMEASPYAERPMPQHSKGPSHPSLSHLTRNFDAHDHGGRFDSVAKSSTSNAKHPGDEY